MCDFSDDVPHCHEGQEVGVPPCPVRPHRIHLCLDVYECFYSMLFRSVKKMWLLIQWGKNFVFHKVNFIICQSCETVQLCSTNILNKSIITTQDLYGHSWDSTKLLWNATLFTVTLLDVDLPLETCCPIQFNLKMHIQERNSMLPPQKSIKYWVNLIVLAGGAECLWKLAKGGGSHLRAEFTLILSQIGYLQG